MDKRQRFTRYVVVWEGAHDRFLQRVLPSGNGQWSRHKGHARLFATDSEASKMAERMEKKLRSQGIKTSVTYRLTQTGLDDFFYS